MEKVRLTPEQLERVRLLGLRVEKARVALANAEHAYNAYLFRLQREYGLIGRKCSLDADTGEITFHD